MSEMVRDRAYLLLITNRKSYSDFRLALKSMILDDFEFKMGVFTDFLATFGLQYTF